MRNGALHDPRTLDHLRQKHLACAEEIAGQLPDAPRAEDLVVLLPDPRAGDFESLLAAVGEALEREREARARCEERLRKAQKIERDALEKLAASEDSLELALATNAERAAKAARRARKSAMDAASGAGGWDEAYADVKEELDALRETLRRREADAAELSRRADAAEARALAAENAALAADANALANEVKELRASQSSMAHEVAMEVTARPSRRTSPSCRR